jgi:hypothetical protein
MLIENVGIVILSFLVVVLTVLLLRCRGSKETQTDSVFYGGWIPPGFKTIAELQELGVLGGMLLDTEGNIVHCTATYKVMLRLIEHGLPNPGSFTAIDATTGKQLPRKAQVFWYWE